ncbi:MAG: hypothetical protein ACD_23C00614G0002, partial [uncultured bacterium]
MVAVAAVFHLQLPVAVIDVRRIAAQHFQAFRGLVHDLVDDDLGLAQVVLQGLHIGVQAAEEETLVAFKARHFLEVVRAFLVELHRIFGGLFVLDLEQLAGVVERPAVEWAGEAALVAVLLAAQHGAAVGTGVDHGVELAVLAARDDDGLAADVRGEVVVDLGDLAFVRQVDPVAFEDVLHLQLEQIGVREDVSAAAIDAVFLVVLQGAFDQGLDIRALGGGSGGVHGGIPRGAAVSCSAWCGSAGEKAKGSGVGQAAVRPAAVDQAARRGRSTSWLSTPLTSALSVKSKTISAKGPSTPCAFMLAASVRSTSGGTRPSRDRKS